jgi:alpha-2-macroglobulin
MKRLLTYKPLLYAALAVGLLVGLGWMLTQLTHQPVPSGVVSVVRVSPVNGASGIALNTPITIAFDQPIVLTDTLAAAAEDPRLNASLPQPLVLSESAGSGVPIEGVGHWLAPSLYGFSPKDGLRAATTYTVSLRADALPGVKVQAINPNAWRFSTASPLFTDVRPFDGAADVPLSSAVEIHLDREVDVASAGAHFRLIDQASNRTVEGAVQPTDHGFVFTPAAPLVPNATYEARLVPGITTTRGLPLRYQPPAWRFTTFSGLEVARVEPADDAIGVPLATSISVIFNHPVVALSSTSDQAGLPNPLEIAPALPGVGRWVAPDTYVYSPTVVLDEAQQYRVQVMDGLRDGEGNLLRETYAWQFNTITLKIASFPSKSSSIGPDREFSVSFSAPVEASSVQAALHLQDVKTGADVPGNVKVDGATATFTPQSLLDRGATYRLLLAPGVRATQGRVSLQRGAESTFTVVGSPALSFSSPKDGAIDVSPRAGGSSDPAIRFSYNILMDAESIRQNLKVEPPTQIFTATDSYIDLDLQPQTSYRVTIGAAAHDIYGIALGQDATITFSTGVIAPKVELVTSLSNPNQPARLSFASGYAIGTYSAYDPARISLRHLGVSSVNYEVYQLALTQVISWTAGTAEEWKQFTPAKATLLQQASVPLSSPPDQEWLDVLNLGRYEPGLYELMVRSPGNLLDYQMMAVSRYTLTIKRSADQLFIWAVDLSDGQPVADLPLTLSFREGSAVKSRELGRTGSDGTLQVSFTEINLEVQDTVALFVSSPAGERFAFATTQWNRDISPSNFNLPAGSARNHVIGNIYTERPLYRGDQTVYLRGTVRIEQDRVYQLPPAGRQVRIMVTNAHGTTILSTLVPLNETGSFSTSLELEQLAPLGTYGIFCLLEGEPSPQNDSSSINAYYDGPPFPAHHFYSSFSVAEYRKPSFNVEINPEQISALPGRTAAMTITARYFSGEPMVNATVRWYVLDAPLDFTSDSAADFRFGQSEEATNFFGPRITSIVTNTTDAQGRLVVKPYIGQFESSRRQVLYAQVTGITGRVDAQALIIAHVGQFYIGLRPERRVARVGQAQAVDVIVLDPAEQPVANSTVKVTLEKREWFNANAQGSEGRFYWTSTISDTPVLTTGVTTDASGRASFHFTPQSGGAYRLVAEGLDDAGNRINSSMLIYVYGNDIFWEVGNTNQITLVADHETYKPGDVASILVPAPYRGMTALITIERGKVIEHQTMIITGTTGIVSVPIHADYTPNVYVSVVLVKPSGSEQVVPDLRVGIINLAVPIEQQLLTIDIKPDKTEAAPQDSVTFVIKVTGSDGKGVPTELSLALVDQALLDLAKKLGRNPTPTYTDGFFGKRTLGVETSNTLVQLVDRVTVRIQPGSKGGAGGQRANPNGPFLEDLRRDFRDTAYWNPSLMTDVDGNARVTVKLPDNLTTWRLVVRGLTTNLRFGQATKDVVVSRQLVIDPVVPSALLVGDHVTIRARVRGGARLGKLEATVRLQADGLKLVGPAEQHVQVAADDAGVQVAWEAEATVAGQATLRFFVQSGDLQDALEQSIPVRRYAAPDIVSSDGQVRDWLTAPLDLPAALPQTTGRELILDLIPSLPAAIGGTLQWLEQQPYESTEQTISGFLPRLAAARTQPRVAGSVQETEIGRSVNLRLQRLYRLQNLDGGWGWWVQDTQSDPYLTAYVTQGLVAARQAGYAIDPQAYGKAIAYLETILNDFTLDVDAKEPWRGNTRSYLLFVLAEAGRPDLSRTLALFDQRDKLATYGQAYLLMTLDDMGSEAARARTLARELSSSAMPRANDVYWADTARELITMSSDTRTTALVLQALVRADSQNTLIPYALRYLMSQRDGDTWRTTQEASAAILALAEYLTKTGSDAASYSYRAALGDRTILEGVVDPGNYTQPISTVVDLAGLQQAGAAQLTIQRETGWLRRARWEPYYHLRVRSYQEVSAIPPIDRGLHIERRYLAIDPNTLLSMNSDVQAIGLGELVLVQIKLTVPDSVRYLAVEDRLPAGLEPLEIAVQSTNPLAQPPPDQSVAEVDLGQVAHIELRRNSVVLFATSLAAGNYSYTYVARAMVAGRFQSPPAVARLVYAPEVFGQSAGTQFVIRERR